MPESEAPPTRDSGGPCVACGKAIKPGHLYVVAGPCHVACKPPARLNVERVREAARTAS